MFTTPSTSATTIPEIREVPLLMEFIGDDLSITSPLPLLSVEPDYITYKLERSEEHLLISFAFPAVVGDDALSVAPTAGGPLPLLGLNQECEVDLTFSPNAPAEAAKPKLPVRTIIRVRPKGGG